MSQIANNRFPRVMLSGGLSVNLNHLKSDRGKLVFYGPVKEKGELSNKLKYKLSIYGMKGQ